MKDFWFRTWGEKWVEEKKNYVKESTYANYRTILINHLIPEFGDLRLNEIDYSLIQKSVIKWASQGRIDGNGGLSSKTIKDIVVVLKMCLRDAEIDERQITKRTGFVYPTVDDMGKRFALTELQFQRYQQAILLNLNTETMGLLLCLYTGMRIGEICALQWRDIDIEERVIYIKRTIQRVYYKNRDNKGATKIIITTPKSKKSVRVIPISDLLFDTIEKKRGASDYYVITGSPKYIEPRLYRKHFMNFIRENSLDYIHFHGLRHTFATRCIAAGADYKTVSELLGHASVNITLNLYVHPHMDQKRKCVNLL